MPLPTQTSQPQLLQVYKSEGMSQEEEVAYFQLKVQHIRNMFSFPVENKLLKTVILI